MFNLRDMLLLYPTEKLVLADSRYYRITWFNISKSSAREIYCRSIDMIDYPHSVERLLIVSSDELEENSCSSEVKEQNHEKPVISVLF
jgi:hypothetical protein